MKQGIIYTISLNIEENNKKFFRYYYTKCWDNHKPKIIAILLNPSKATLTRNDKTLDFLTEYFINKGYGSMTILNLFSFMCTCSNKISNTKQEYEKKNWQYVKRYINKNKEKDFFIGWGNSFYSIKNDKFIQKAKGKKKDIESFFRKNKLKDKVFCFRSQWGKALHPSRYKENWEYGKYFLN
ncbi:DUF1643 domain-containing protein [Clostridium oceanicum]|uniref:DUF1643 domain-containing protein n=1 Tax=Clostridium oceanicum TaxID=1543 RepID=A0ABN1JCH7_9CLOT